MAEVHLSHTKMQRSVQKQLTRIDPSFMVETTRTGSSRRDREAPAPQTRAFPMTALPPTALPAAPPIDPAKLFFGDSVASLAGRLASVSLYEQRNDDFMHILQQAEHMSPPAVQQLQTLCKRYQDGRIKIHEWTQRLWELLGNERAPRLAPLLIELQLDERKKVEMSRAVQAHVHKLEAFPPLPATRRAAAAGAAGDSWNYTGEAKKVVPSTGKTIRLVSTNRMTSADPSKNPLGLSGFGAGIGRAPGKKKEKAVMPQAGFSQAAAAGTGTAMASVAPIAVPGAPPVDEAQFPSLPGSKAKGKPSTRPPLAPTANAFAAVDLDDDDGNFVVGGAASPTLDASSSGGKKKSKRQVVLRFG